MTITMLMSNTVKAAKLRRASRIGIESAPRAAKGTN